MFSGKSTVQSIMKYSEDLDTMFLAWIEANKKHPEGRYLTYDEFPTRFV